MKKGLQQIRKAGAGGAQVCTALKRGKLPLKAGCLPLRFTGTGREPIHLAVLSHGLLIYDSKGTEPGCISEGLSIHLL